MASLRAIDGAWVLDWRDQGGQRHRDTLGRVDTFPEKEARRILEQRNRELSAGFRILNPQAAPRFSAFATDYLVWHSVEFPASHYRVKQIVEQYLIPAFQHSRLDAIKPRDVEAWKHRRLAPRDDRPKSETVAKELRTLKAMLSKAVEWKVITEHPIPHVSAPLSLDSKPPRFFTKDELHLIYAACRMKVNGGEGQQPVPLHAEYWRLFANTGMRRGEGLALKRAWIGQDGMKILSTDEERTKSGKWRDIPITDGARRALEAIPKDGQYVIRGIEPESLSRACIRDVVRAGLHGSLHILRHTYISHLVMAGVPLRTVQKLAGHSTIMVTERYSHLTPGHLLDAGRKISL